MLCVCDNGSVNIYDTKTLSLVNSFILNPEVNVPIQFSIDSDSLIFLKDSENLVFSDFNGNEIKSLHVKDSLAIKNVKVFNADNKYIAVQTSNDDILLYSYNDLSYLKKYSSCDKACMTDFLFSYNFDYLIQAYENGYIYRTDIKEKKLDKSVAT
nr:hypothetical protein [Treponema sp.]